MSEASLPTSPDRGCRILHITHCPNDSSSRIAAAVRERRGSVHVCRDVYGGLAMLGRDNCGDIDAVMLCLDSLSLAGYGFIEEVVRSGQVPVFVYASRGYEAMISKALALGARGAIEPTGDSVGEMLAAVGFGGGGTGGNGEAVTSSPGRSKDESDAVSGDVRVPWRDDVSRPVRTPPGVGGLNGSGATGSEGVPSTAARASGDCEGDEAVPASDEPARTGETLPVELGDGPLLSAEEIACLLYDGPTGDDVEAGDSVGQEE